ncbi:DUF859 family phage minor structural protein [Anaerococcus vaginalis]|uniref:DUF859 family phage minor structural protein n=1 Tax=Anaerococcus vaginalis TaxID=33037 RepID=UPI00290C06DB|nr:DUF859 family phage minor structural protein [Anaerococcus vaginalis]MDU5253051.1 DUF859 family phage minor structural protein [Anaerococcus vaginalis]MDU6781636.1 DUF859 family phage minor structural protein [Anaerococcus vaginalis]
MATYNASIRNGTGTIHLEIRQQSQSIANNTSTVYYRLYIQGKGGYGFWNNYHTGKTSVVINGSTVHSQTGRDFDIRNGGTQQLASGTTIVKHNEDGTKSFSFSASLWSSKATGSISGSFTLSKIPRASSFNLQNTSGTNISSIYAGNTVKIAINKKVSSFTHTIKLSYSGTGETVANKTTSSSVNWSNSEKVMTNYMQNLKSMNLTFTLETYDGSTRIGTSSKNLTLNVPNSASPTINSVNVTEANQNKINIIGSSPFYQLLSDLNVVTNASGKYGASIKNISVNLGNLSKSGSNVILDNVNLKGDQNIKVTVQDSRGFSASTTKTINLSPYNLPNISFFNAYREETNTKYASARMVIESTVIDNKNPLEVKVDVVEKDSTSWKNVYSATVGNGKFNGTISLGGGFDDFKAYDVRLSIADKFKRHQAISSISTTSQSLVIGANKPVVGVGRVPTHIDKGLEVDGDICLNGELKPFGEAGKVIDLTLSDGLSGFIKTIKDPLGGVRIWGKVDVTNSNPIKKYYTWATLPKGYSCNRFIGFSIYSYILNGRLNIIPGMAITDDGRIRYVGIINENDKIEVGSTNEFTFYFKTEEAW